MNFWYKLFTWLLYPAIPFYLYFRRLKKKEHPLRYTEKLSKINKLRGDGFLIWFHVASVGEAMSILPLIEYCLKESKINKILITSITLSSGEILEKKFNKNSKVTHQFLPFDIPLLVNKFLMHWKPDLSIFIDSEIWPNLIFEINKKKIPLLLINARITKKTFNRWKLIINFANKIFGKFDLCIASNSETENYLKILGAKNIKKFGNLKFSSIRNDLNIKLKQSFLQKIENRKLWCAASTHFGEELICAKTHLEIKKIYSNVLTIIIPRHINRVEKINNELSNLNLNVVLNTNLDALNSDTDILLVDSYGETLKFYNITKCVFIGKSLSKSSILEGGQNPIEPARLGCKIFHGPNVNNFREAYVYLNTLGATKQINSPEELNLSLVEELKKDTVKSDEISKKIENYGQAILNSVILELKKYI